MNPMRVTIRARVLRVLNESSQWMKASTIAQLANLTYHQTIYALNALHNAGHVARLGRKSTSQWGSLAIQHDPTDEALSTLTQHFPHAAPTHHP